MDEEEGGSTVRDHMKTDRACMAGETGKGRANLKPGWERQDFLTPPSDPGLSGHGLNHQGRLEISI